MRRLLFLFMCMSLISLSAGAQKVTIKAKNQPASIVFRSIMQQTGMNFIYSSDLLKDLKVTVDVANESLTKTLDYIFKNTPITYKISGNNVILKKEKKKIEKPKKPKPPTKIIVEKKDTAIPTILKEIVVFPQDEMSNVEIPEIGFKRLTADEIKKTPTLFGENDIIRTLHTQPGVVEGTEGMAGMFVDGGNKDENLYILDNVPLYQVNHFGGLFSAFNTDIIRHADFYKTGVPAKYDGRLSSFMDVKLVSGRPSGHHGSARLGLTSGAFNITGPIGNKTYYLASIRRSWYDVITLPVLAIVNSARKDQKVKFNYYFTDLNVKIYHTFNPNLSGYLGLYYGNDQLIAGSKDKMSVDRYTWYDESNANFNWGNLVAQAGLNYRISPYVSSEFTLAYNNFFSRLRTTGIEKDLINDNILEYSNKVTSRNDIKDILTKADFSWIPKDNIRTEFGIGYTCHFFQPDRITKEFIFDGNHTLIHNTSRAIPANELNSYFQLDWRISDNFRVDAGLHGSLFSIEHKTHAGLSPRLSLNYRIGNNFALKASYSHTVQYVNQLSHSYLSLPTDQWVPITGDFKPEKADKVAVGAYWKSDNKMWEVSLSGYYKKMKNILDFKDEYYLLPSTEMWTGQLTQGSGTAKGLELKIEKKVGKITGNINYTLAWVDLLFPEKNGGLKYPARYDNRHTIKVLLNWDINEKVSLNAVWIGRSGNRFTLLPQSFQEPDFDGSHYPFDWGVPKKENLNNYRLPFYHRLDLACNVKNRHGFWTFSLYNAYCHLNTVAIVRESIYSKDYYQPDNYGTVPVFKTLKLFPIIPSVSYTWEF